MLSVVDAIRQRRSVRAFQPREVPESTLHEIFSQAQWAPSNCNTQPWVVHVVSGARCDRLRQRLQQAGMDPSQFRPDFPFDGRYPGVYKERQHDAAAQLYGAMGIAREDKAARGAAFMRNFAFFDAPHVAFLFIPEWSTVREAADAGMYAQTLMLALAAHGLASCPQTALSFAADAVREECGVDAAWKLLFGISFGREDAANAANACRIGRAAVADNVRFVD